MIYLTYFYNFFFEYHWPWFTTSLVEPQGIHRSQDKAPAPHAAETVETVEPVDGDGRSEAPSGGSKWPTVNNCDILWYNYNGIRWKHAG